MVFDDESIEIGEEINEDEIQPNLVNNVISKPKEFSEPSRGNTYFMRPRHVLAGRIANFSFSFIQRKTMTFEEINVTPISQTRYILNINGACNKEEIFEHQKRGMNSISYLRKWVNDQCLDLHK